MSERWPRDPRDPATWPRLFTVAEAEALLPEIVPLLMELRAHKVALDSALAALQKLTPAMRRNGHAPRAQALDEQIHDRAMELRAGIEHLADQGIEVKSLDHGLIDFPSPREGRVVYLCWRLGEGARLRYWHEIDTGFAGRRSLNE